MRILPYLVQELGGLHGEMDHGFMHFYMYDGKGFTKGEAVTLIARSQATMLAS